MHKFSSSPANPLNAKSSWHEGPSRLLPYLSHLSIAASSDAVRVVFSTAAVAAIKNLVLDLILALANEFSDAADCLRESRLRHTTTIQLSISERNRADTRRS
ncbi:hypothetical protein DL98DRAFT_661452 [Cadophora sp. DSE1049]|nr:hypothetical protein DL98DRAFT_661452 [Cadophora sp. DSE1049]